MLILSRGNSFAHTVISVTINITIPHHIDIRRSESGLQIITVHHKLGYANFINKKTLRQIFSRDLIGKIRLSKVYSTIKQQEEQEAGAQKEHKHVGTNLP